MDGSVSPGPAGRKRLMEMYRRHPDPAVRRRAQIVLLLSDGRSWSFIESSLYCIRRTMDELLDLVFEWLQHRRPFEVERDAYLRSKAA